MVVIIIIPPTHHRLGARSSLANHSRLPAIKSLIRAFVCDTSLLWADSDRKSDSQEDTEEEKLMEN